ncbi:MAG: c-type cytochrome [Gammaproteobacteria bacterium]
MSSRCPRSNSGALRTARSTLACIVLVSAAMLGGCEREDREFADAPAQTQTAQSDASTLQPETPQPRLSTLQPGAAQPISPSATGSHYENNAFHVSEGSRWYTWFNCNGCHGNGGGAIGPALMDAQWRYGGSIDHVYASIMEGRPNGMPTWRGKLTEQQAWQLAAYVRALAGNVRKDAVPSRRDAMTATPPLTQLPEQVPRNGDASAQTVPPQ